jgi:hypothetical protein
MSIAPEVRHALSGQPVIGTWDPIFPFLTIDPNGYPHVCLLGRAELEATDDHIHAVITGRTTATHLALHGQATLVLIGADSATYGTLRKVGEPITEGPFTGYTFEVAATKHDTAGVAMRPAQFLPTRRLATHEGWKTTRRILHQLSTRNDCAQTPATGQLNTGRRDGTGV